MAQRIVQALVCLVLALGGAACTPQLVGPTAGSSYVFSLQVSNPIVWLGPAEPSMAAQLPKVAELIVRVQDAQGRPAEGVPVTFEVEPGWARSVSISPSQTSTRGGIARAFFFDPQTTGVVRVMARVDNMTAQATVTVQSYSEPHRAE